MSLEATFLIWNNGGNHPDNSKCIDKGVLRLGAKKILQLFCGFKYCFIRSLRKRQVTEKTK